MDPDERDALAALLDVQEGRLAVPLLGDAAIAALLRTARRVAVIGASDRPGRPSRSVMEHLLHAGYDVVPVTPGSPTVLGVRAFPTLAEAVAATGAFEIVDAFRRSAKTPAPAREAATAGAAVLWLQLGIANWEAARIARAGGLAVVMDRCISVEHHRLLRGG